MRKIFLSVMIMCLMTLATVAADSTVANAAADSFVADSSVAESATAARGKKILYVPIDSRPCNFAQVVQVAEKLGYEILTPPAEILGAEKFHGDPDKMWQWLDANAAQADYAVLSTDALIYGSLVASRLHNSTAEEILSRVSRFEDFDRNFPHLQIYAFATIMRTPRGVSYPGLEPDYYATHGPKIFQYTALLDRQDTEKLSRKNRRELDRLKTDIPAEYLTDWFNRRRENFDANKYLLNLTREGVFDYFLLGCDDSAEFSQTHMESRLLTEMSADMGKTVTQVTSGADELGMLMISRAINRDRDYMPFVSVAYNAGKGEKTFPTYCNEPIGVSIDAAIIAAGGMKIPAHERADLVLAVNTRADGKTFAANDGKRNKSNLRGDIKTFMAIVEDLTAKNYPVAIADVTFANGADNALMNQLRRRDLQYKIRAYGGWNTATNSSGFVIGAGVLARHMTDGDVCELLTTRYLDDWIYQANVRQEVVAHLYAIGENPWNIGDNLPQIERLLTEKMTAFAEKNLRLPNHRQLSNVDVTLPWRRTFECNPRFAIRN